MSASIPSARQPRVGRNHPGRARWALAPALVATAAMLLVTSHPAEAGIVPTVTMGTAANYSVLGATTVTNTNASVLAQSVGLSPGSSIVGFPPGIVLAPSTIEAANPVTLQAQNDLITAYNDAAGRVVEFTQTNPDLVGQTLVPGVYAASAKAPLGLSGQLILDGQNNPNAVFIFQTDSTLITSTGSTIELINGASECNIFWQVGSSATLASGSVFVGNILALTSITVQSAVVVHGRALAQTGAVTLDNDTFTQPSCIPTTATVAPATTVAPAVTTASTAPATPISTVDTTPPPGVTEASVSDTTPFVVTDITLPRTGSETASTSAVAAVALVAGAGVLLLARRRRPTT
jgi:LPXTG-motif cell wall-anchored protein